MKIVLATPPADGSKCGRGMPPPLGLIYVATAAQKTLGEKITIVDAYSEGLYAEEAAERVLAHQPDIFGLSVMSTNINRGLKLLKMVKQARPTVTTTSWAASTAPSLTGFCSGKSLKRTWCSGGRGKNLFPDSAKPCKETGASPDCLGCRIGTREKLSGDSPRLFRTWMPCHFRTAPSPITRGITPNGATGRRASACR